MGDDDRRPDALDELATLRARLTELQAEAQEANRLRAELSLFRELVQESRGLMCVHDLEGNLLFVNAAAAAALGFQADDGVGWNLRRFLAPAVEQEFDAYLAKIRHASWWTRASCVWPPRTAPSRSGSTGTSASRHPGCPRASWVTLRTSRP